jgi:hypothetical protein
MRFFSKLSINVLAILLVFRVTIPFNITQDFLKPNFGTNGAIITSVKDDQGLSVIQNQRKSIQYSYSYIDLFYKTVFSVLAYFSIKSIILYREIIIDLRNKIYIFKSPILYGSNYISKPSFLSKN